MPKQPAKKKNNSSRGRLWAVILAVLLAVGGFALAFPPDKTINQGLDIQGGLSVYLKATPENGQELTEEQLDTSVAVITNRVNALGASEATVVKQGNDGILVQIPGLSDSTAALDVIGSTGVLEFARLDSFTDETVKNNIDSGNIVDYTSIETPQGDVPTGGDNLADYSSAKHITVPSGTYTPIFTGDHISAVNIGRESDASAYYSVNVTLDQEAAQAFASATSELYPTHGKIVILLDGEVNSAPAVQASIMDGHVSITGNYTLDEAKALQTVLDSGSLPVTFTYEQAQTVGPTLGQGEFQAGVLAMLLGLIVVILYLLVFYRGMGIIPAISMCIFACVYLGVLAGLSSIGLFSLSLAGIAGVILSIGMAADAAVLTIEKFKEEIKQGKSLKVASNEGVRHAMITSIDANIVSILSALALFFLASSAVKGFGLTLSIGIVCNIIVILLFIAPITRLLAPRVMRSHPAFWDVKYSLELGDVRTGSENYMTPAEVTIAKEKEDTEKANRKQRTKAAAASQKKHDKAANARAKEIRKQTKADEKQKIKEEKAINKAKLEELKAQDAERDAARKSARKAEKEKRRAAEEVEEAVEVIDELEEQIVDESTNADNEAEVIEEPAGEEAQEIVESTDRKDEEDEPKSSEEIASLIAQSANFVDTSSNNLPRVTDETMKTSGPSDSQESIFTEANKDAQNTGQPRMNRAQRRAQERANKKKKN